MRLFALCLFFCMFSLPLWAEDRAEANGEYAHVTLQLGQWEGDVLQGALDFRLKDGWKTYWRSPGDGGVPLALEVLPEQQGMIAVHPHWPAPTRFVEEWGLEVFGFKNHLLLPVEFHMEAGKDAAHIAVKGSYAVCKDICITEEFQFSLPVIRGETAPHGQVQQAFALAEKPLAGSGWSLKDITMEKEAQGKGELQVIFTKTGKVGKVEDVFVETDEAGFRFPKGRKRYTENGVEFTLPYEVSPPATTALGGKVRFTLVEDDRPYHASEVTLPEKLEPRAGQDAGKSRPSLYAMLWLAFLGGLILNIMPCVLPVVSLKMVHVLKKGGEHLSVVRRSFLMTAFGVLAFFFAFAVLVVLLRMGGETMGWGFHFQSPLFLSLLTVVIWVFAGNLLGVFEFRLPQSIAQREHKAISHAAGLKRDFLTGAFAALMATPCTAPFLGTAVAFALTQGQAGIFAIFLALGLGLAFPFLLMSCMPGWARLLPKPGLWMVRVKQVMGGLLVLSGLWFLWVITLQKDAATAGMVLLTAGSILAFFHVKERKAHPGRIGVFVIALMVMMVVSVASPAKPARVEAGEGWQVFSENALYKAVSEGQVVFVDMTAAWCLNCKFNKLRVLDREETRDFFQEEGVIPMRGDLTRPQPEYEAFVKAHGRAGIPFNMVYGPFAPDGMVLSEVLSLEELRNAVWHAKGAKDIP